MGLSGVVGVLVAVNAKVIQYQSRVLDGFDIGFTHETFPDVGGKIGSDIYLVCAQLVGDCLLVSHLDLYIGLDGSFFRASVCCPPPPVFVAL